MKVLITGANGFIGKNFVSHLAEHKSVEILRFTHEDHISKLPLLLLEADFVFHFAGVNRPEHQTEFKLGNTDLTHVLCDMIGACGRSIPVVYTSSIQAELDNPYGTSKRAAEDALLQLASNYGSPVYLFRLPNVFGKWARPNYNSAVATFCYNIARDIPIQINSPDAVIRLVYIDDVIKRFLAVMEGEIVGDPFVKIEPQYTISVAELAQQLRAFRNSRQTLLIDAVGAGLVRALYSTYVSYLPTESFAYEVPKYGDSRGVFVEMLKTHNSGQFSFFSAHPGITRGGHYHHSKTEKFLVIKGKARFRFRHVVTNDYYELTTTEDKPEVVETVPGWTHDITNIGDDEMVVMLWANEVFDRAHPDTYACQI